jgi:DNA-binding MarR family transcriptional regulator
MKGTAQLANEAWEALLHAHAVLMKEFTASGVWDEITIREYDVLYTLSKSPEPMRLGELHNHVLLSQPALSRLVDRLVTRDLIDKVTDPVDARGVQLSLTDTGRATQRRVGARHARSVATAMTSALSNEQLAALKDLCTQLTDQAGDGYAR